MDDCVLEPRRLPPREPVYEARDQVLRQQRLEQRERAVAG
jgi:hypothetical protein